jgi:flagellar motility protein MotE (MotC chaperone)
MSGLLKTIMLVIVGLALGSGTTLFMLSKTTDKILSKVAAAKAETEAKKIPEKPWDFWTVEMENLSNDLKEERAKIKTREEAVAQREALLAVEQRELDKTRKQIDTLRINIDQRIIEVKTEEMANLKRLSQTYATLSPKSAVAIFKQMDDTVLAKTFSLMKPDVVGTFFEEMGKQSASDPDLAKRAAILSEKLRLIKANKPATTGGY